MANSITITDPADPVTGNWEPDGNGVYRATGNVATRILGNSLTIECRVVYDSGTTYPPDIKPGAIDTFSRNTWHVEFPSLNKYTPDAVLIALLLNNGQLEDVKAIDVSFSALERAKRDPATVHKT